MPFCGAVRGHDFGLQSGRPDGAPFKHETVLPTADSYPDWHGMSHWRPDAKVASHVPRSAKVGGEFSSHGAGRQVGGGSEKAPSVQERNENDDGTNPVSHEILHVEP